MTDYIQLAYHFKSVIIVPFAIWSDGLVVKALDFQSGGPEFKTSGWLQGQLRISSFRSQLNEYQELLETDWSKIKLSPSSGCAAYRQLNPIPEKVP